MIDTAHQKWYYIADVFSKNMYLIEKNEKPNELHSSTISCDTEQCNQTGSISIK